MKELENFKEKIKELEAKKQAIMRAKQQHKAHLLCLELERKTMDFEDDSWLPQNRKVKSILPPKKEDKKIPPNQKQEGDGLLPQERRSPSLPHPIRFDRP